MTTNEKIAKIDKLGKEITDTLKEFGLHYRLVIVGENGEAAVESDTLTEIEKFTDAAIICSRLLRKYGIPRKVLWESLNNIFDGIDEEENA